MNEHVSAIRQFAGKPFGSLLLRATAKNPPDLNIQLVNYGKEPVVVAKWKGDSEYLVRVSDGEGKDVPMTDRGKKFFGHGELLDIRTLQPDEAIEATLPISELFDMRAPGEYTVLTSLPVVGDVDAVLTAAPITIRIPEAKRPHPKE
ncbi:MAG: hypothetical protein ABSG68_00885 [Thermoguttaceae bacterium]|jgi:hypothetical protein